MIDGDETGGTFDQGTAFWRRPGFDGRSSRLEAGDPIAGASVELGMEN